MAVDVSAEVDELCLGVVYISGAVDDLTRVEVGVSPCRSVSILMVSRGRTLSDSNSGVSSDV